MPPHDDPVANRVRATILASGAGTNARNVLDCVAEGLLPLTVGAVISNDPLAGALDVAREHAVAAHAVSWKRATETRAAYDARLIAEVARTEPELVLLLGWMHLLPSEFLVRFPAVLNVHPAYLPLDPSADAVAMPDGTTIPALRGAHAVRDAVRAGLPWSGASVHAVTEETDRGTIYVRIPLAVPPGTNEARLRAEIRRLEFRAVPTAILRWLAERGEMREEGGHGE